MESAGLGCVELRFQHRRKRIAQRAYLLLKSFRLRQPGVIQSCHSFACAYRGRCEAEGRNGLGKLLRTRDRRGTRFRINGASTRKVLRGVLQQA